MFSVFDVDVLAVVAAQRTQGVTNSKSQVTERMKWDKEMFVHQMKNLRGWLHSRAESKWDELAMDSGNHADQLGPDPKFPLRMFIPAILVGTDRENSSVTTFETKSVEERNKQQKSASDETKEAWLKETRQGFGSISGVTAAQAASASSSGMIPSANQAAYVEDMLLTMTGHVSASDVEGGDKHKDKDNDNKNGDKENKDNPKEADIRTRLGLKC